MRENARMRSRWWLIIWLVGILFPIAGLRQVSRLRTAFDAIFSPDWVHVVMHMLLFGGLAVLLFAVLRWPFNGRNVFLALGVVLAVGALQEGLQAMVQPFWLQGVLYDLGVDLAGGMLGVGVMAAARWMRLGYRSWGGS